MIYVIYIYIYICTVPLYPQHSTTQRITFYYTLFVWNEGCTYLYSVSPLAAQGRAEDDFLPIVGELLGCAAKLYEEKDDHQDGFGMFWRENLAHRIALFGGVQ